MINIPAQISAIAKTAAEKLFFNITTSFYCFGGFLLPQYANFTPKKWIFHLDNKPKNDIIPANGFRQPVQP
jgi:hypothetical protein